MTSSEDFRFGLKLRSCFVTVVIGVRYVFCYNEFNATYLNVTYHGLLATRWSNSTRFISAYPARRLSRVKSKHVSGIAALDECQSVPNS